MERYRYEGREEALTPVTTVVFFRHRDETTAARPLLSLPEGNASVTPRAAWA